ncbi:MAG: deiodinase [Phycisphaerales bacterium]|nr:deiodinase [Phycisphaerales bacterium]
MYQAYRDRVAFLFVYIHEAHPDDGWQMESNRTDNVVLAQPKTFGERRSTAKRCATALDLTMPCIVDDMDNTVDNAYAGWPERLFVIDAAGIVRYAGGVGPFGFNPDELSDWLKKHVGPPRS